MYKLCRAAGYCKVSARRIMRQLTDYELIILQDLVTNQTKLTKMEDIKGLKKAKDNLYRNLKLAASFKTHKDLSKLIEITPGVLLYGKRVPLIQKQIDFQFSSSDQLLEYKMYLFRFLQQLHYVFL